MLVDKITSQEKAMIDLMREHYSVDSENTDFVIGEFVSCDEFLTYWEEAKAPWAQVFDESLIIKKNISTFIEDDDLYYNLRNISYDVNFSRFCIGIYDMLTEYNPDFYISDDNLYAWAMSMEEYKGRKCIERFMRFYVLDTELWMNNIYNGPTFEIKVNDNTYYKFTTGCKIMKILGKLANYSEDKNIIDAFEKVRLMHSMVMNEARINSTLCVSIHPLDYMTASYNNSDWRSCMCWTDGEYRRGVVEMMNSPVVVVAYLESKSKHLTYYDGYNTPKMTWNSKKWREFFIVTPEYISGIKGYPYWNHQVEDEALKMIKDLFSKIYPQYNSCDTISHYKVDELYIDDARNFSFKIHPLCGPAMYNDFYGSNEYHAYFTDALADKNSIDTIYSGVSECVCCGKVTSRHPYITFNSEGDLICLDCIEHFTCCKCGDEIYSEDDLVVFNDRNYCLSCYEDLTSCINCGNIFDKEYDEDCIVATIGRDENTTTDVMQENRFNPFTLAVCNCCLDDVFTEGKKELELEHKTYTEWWWASLPIVPMARIKQKVFNDRIPTDIVERFKHNKTVLNAVIEW